MKQTVFVRLLRIAILSASFPLLFVLLIVVSLVVPRDRGLIYRAKLIGIWSRMSLWALGVSVSHAYLNQETTRARVIVANHVSTLDVIVLAARGRPTLFLGKAELAGWPILGPILKASGMVFVKRESLFSRAKSIIDIQERLRSGCDVVIFPEGTTSIDGPRVSVRPYFAGAFRVSRMEDAPIEIVHLEFSNPEQVSFLGEEGFVSHFWRMLSGPMVSVRLRSLLIDPVASRRDQRRKHFESRRWLLEGGTNLISCLASFNDCRSTAPV